MDLSSSRRYGRHVHQQSDRATELGELLLQTSELFVGEVLEIDEVVAGGFHGADELMELELDRLRLAVLRVLNDEHHEERDDRRAGVDRQLP
jgi:hypothetical protein